MPNKNAQKEQVCVCDKTLFQCTMYIGWFPSDHFWVKGASWKEGGEGSLIGHVSDGKPTVIVPSLS